MRPPHHFWLLAAWEWASLLPNDTLMNTDSLTVPRRIDIVSDHTGSMPITGQISHVQRQSGYSRKAYECIIYVMIHAFSYNTDIQACDQTSANVLWNLKRLKSGQAHVPTWLHFSMVMKAGCGFKKKKKKLKGFCLQPCIITACQDKGALNGSDCCVYGLWHALSLFLWDWLIFIRVYKRGLSHILTKRYWINIWYLLI